MTRNDLIKFLGATAVVALTALATPACGDSGKRATGAPGPPTTASGRPATVGVESNNKLGRILDDTRGGTLYLFQKDVGTNSTCTDACATLWPPLRANGKPVVGTGASAAMVGTTPRSDGKPQVTYNGHPLYTYMGDQKPGDTNGQGLTAFGGGWFVLSPAGIRISGQGSGAGGGGY
jgi:predicted lipoprotein with Yx(FWY)xxD motif